MAADAEARIWGVIGASGTGKGLWVKQRLRELAPPRIVFWDFKNEYQEFTGERKDAPARSTLAQLRAAMLKAGADGPLRIRYAPRGSGEKALRKEFEAVCELVYAWENTTFVAEELANVTTPGWAPASWRKMTTSGRHARIHIIGATQTPALVDKSFLGNCTLIHCCALREHQHREAVARSLDIDSGRLAALVRFQWIEKDFDSGKVTDGWVQVPGKAAKNAPTGTPPSGTPTGTATPGQPAAPARKVALRLAQNGVATRPRSATQPKEKP
jgi:hypothetical protein